MARAPDDGVANGAGASPPPAPAAVVVVGYLSLDEIVLNGHDHLDVPGGAAICG